MLLGLLLVLGAPSAGQTPEEVVAPPPPQPFELSEVPTEAERLARLEREARQLAEPDAVIDEITEQSRAFAEELAEARDQLDRELARDVRLAGLSDLEEAWLERQRTVSVWSGRLEQRLANLEAMRKEFAARRVRWEATLAQARAEDTPAAVRGAVREALDGLAAADRRVSQRLGQLFALQQKLATLASDGGAALAAIHSRRGTTRMSLLSPERPPLWQLPAPVAADELVESLRGRAGADWQEFVAYWSSPRAPVRRLVATVVLAWLVILVLRARARDWAEDDPRRERARLLLRRPWSMALVAGLSLAPLWVEHSPRPVIELMGLVLLAPALRVLSVAVPSGFQGWLAGLAAFYLFDRLRGIIEPLAELERWMLVSELGLALAALLWLLRPRRLEREQSFELTSPALLWALTRLGVVLLGAAIAANVLGYVDLSRVVGEGVLYSAYLGVVVMGALQVGRNFLAILLGSETARTVRMIRFQPRRVRAAVRRGMAWAAALVWLHFALGIFAIRDAVYGSATAWLGTSVSVGELDLRLGDPLLVVAILWVATKLSTLLRFLLEVEVFPRVRMQRGVPHALSTMLHYGIVVLGLWIAFSAVGLPFDRLALVLGALGVGIGFGLQNAVNNFVSGLILLFERPVQVGDTVQMGLTHGDVRRIGIRSSTIRTWDGAEIIVPNADLVSQQVTNWTLSDRRRRIDLDFGVAYGTDPERVQALLLEVASHHGKVLESPKPYAAFMEFGDSALLFQLRVWVSDPDHWITTRSEINVGVNTALAEAGIEVPFPQRDLHFRSPLSDPAASGPSLAPSPPLPRPGSEAGGE